MIEKETNDIRNAVLVIDKFIADHLWSLDPRTPNRWYDVKTEIDKLYQKENGKSIYGQH